MAERPTDLPELAHGEGSWGYDEQRRKVTLRHSWLGKPYIERAETPGECLVARDRRRHDANVRAGLVPDGTLGTLLEDWLEWVSRNRADKTVDGYRDSIRIITAALGAGTQLEDVTVVMVETMLADLVDRGRGSASMNKICGHWKSALGFAERRERIALDVSTALRRAERPNLPPATVRDNRWFDLPDFEIVRGHLLRRQSPRNALFMTMMLCGLRPAEAMALRWSYVDVVHRRLRVEGTIKRDSKQGSYSTVLKTDHKHRHAHREIPIPGDLALVLDTLARDESGFVFVEVDGKARGCRVGFDAVHRHAAQIALDCRVPHINPNGYRHTFASVCRHHGMPYEQLAKLMGHQDASMIIQTYGHPIVPTSPVDMDRYLGTAEV